MEDYRVALVLQLLSLLEMLNQNLPTTFTTIANNIHYIWLEKANQEEILGQKKVSFKLHDPHHLFWWVDSIRTGLAPVLHCFNGFMRMFPEMTLCLCNTFLKATKKKDWIGKDVVSSGHSLELRKSLGWETKRFHKSETSPVAPRRTTKKNDDLCKWASTQTWKSNITF